MAFPKHSVFHVDTRVLADRPDIVRDASKPTVPRDSFAGMVAIPTRQMEEWYHALDGLAIGQGRLAGEGAGAITEGIESVRDQIYGYLRG